MTNQQIKRLLPFASVVVLVTAALAPAPAGADIAAEPISLQMSVMDASVTLGEPFVLQYRINNNTHQEADIYMGEDKKAWATFGLTDEIGRTVAGRPTGNGPIPGLHSNGLHVSPDSTYIGYLVEKKVWPSKPGHYVLSVHTHVFYQNATVPSTSGAFEADYRFTVTVAPADAGRLYASADALRRTIMTSQDARARQAAMEALFAMPEAEAQQTWETLVEDPHLSRDAAVGIAKELAAHDSLTAANLLAGMEWDPQQEWPDGKVAVLPYLQQLHSTGSAPVKTHIERLFAEHGESIPTRFIGPID